MARRPRHRDPHRGVAHPRRHDRAGAARRGVPAVGAVAEIIAALSDAASRGLPIVAYNAAYDLTLLEREALRYGLTPLPGPGPVIDPLVIDKAIDRFRRGKRTLTATAEHYRVALPNAHDAGADAVAAGRVAQAIVRAFPELAAIAVGDLHARQVDWCREQAESYQAYRRANGEPEFTTSGAWPVRGPHRQRVDLVAAGGGWLPAPADPDALF